MAIPTGGTRLDGWVKQMIDAGIVPPMARRVLIDVAINEPVKVYYDCYGDAKMLTAELIVALKNVEVVSASMVDAPASEPISPDESVKGVDGESVRERTDGIGTTPAGG